MQELDKTVTRDSILDKAQKSFNPLFNLSRINSTEGEMIFTEDKIYYFFENEAVQLIKKPWCVDIAEIASWKKSGLAGYVITLNDGTELRFSNVFRKMREGITAAIEERK